MKHLSRRLVLTNEDLDQIRNLFGTKVAFYFAFIEAYVVFLTFPAVTGLIAWRWLPGYSVIYGIVTCVWCTVFLEYWKLQEIDLSIRWKVRGVGSVKITRPQFRWEKILVDEAGRTRHYCPKWKQVARQLLQIPFILFAVTILSILILGVFAVETLVSESYGGPFKNFMVRFLSLRLWDHDRRRRLICNIGIRSHYHIRRHPTLRERLPRKRCYRPRRLREPSNRRQLRHVTHTKDVYLPKHHQLPPNPHHLLHLRPVREGHRSEAGEDDADCVWQIRAKVPHRESDFQRGSRQVADGGHRLDGHRPNFRLL